jgi:hypothetical protein
MSCLWFRLRCWLRAALLVAAGCTTTQTDLRPPKQPEQYNLPPDAEARFDKPLTYPADVMKQAPSKRTMSAKGGGPGLGGMGMGGGGLGGMGMGGGGMGGMGMGGT